MHGLSGWNKGTVFQLWLARFSWLKNTPRQRQKPGQRTRTRVQTTPATAEAVGRARAKCFPSVHVSDYSTGRPIRGDNEAVSSIVLGWGIQEGVRLCSPWVRLQRHLKKALSRSKQPALWPSQSTLPYRPLFIINEPIWGICYSSTKTR